MFATDNGLIEINNNFYFSGFSAGFSTYVQSNTYTSTLTNTDGYLYIYKFDHEPSYNCLFEETISRSVMNSQVTTIIESQFYSSDTYIDFQEQDSSLRKTRL